MKESVKFRLHQHKFCSLGRCQRFKFSSWNSDEKSFVLCSFVFLQDHFTQALLILCFLLFSVFTPFFTIPTWVRFFKETFSLMFCVQHFFKGCKTLWIWISPFTLNLCHYFFLKYFNFETMYMYLRATLIQYLSDSDTKSKFK